MTTWSESDYYDIIGSSGCRLIVMGERGEQWTEETLRLFQDDEVRVDFLPWSQVADLRVQLELVFYPAVQLWRAGALKAEVSGYHCDSLKKLIQSM